MLKFLKFANRMRGKFESVSFEKSTAEPEKTQRRFLFDLLRENAETLFGKAHGFDKIRDEKEFCRKIPIRGFEDFRPFINRIIAGEKQVLTADEPVMLAMTSGTTDEPKFIPVTRKSQKLNSRLMRQWLYRAELDHAGLTAHSSVGIVSRAVEGFTASGLPFGSASGVIYKNIPRAIRRAYAVPYLVSEIENYDERYFVLARFAFPAQVSLIATPNPSTLLRLAKICAKNQEKLIRAIYEGNLGIELENKKLERELSAMLAPDPKRAGFLSGIMEKKGFPHLADCWSDLKLIGCWLGGSVGAQACKLRGIFGDVPLRDLGFIASEGNMTLPFEDGTSAGILALENNFYEFMPEEESDSENPASLLSNELEIGKRYGILITSAAGLYRYRLDDIVEVKSFYHQTPIISFVRKAGEMSNITGEKIHANHFLEAFEMARRKFDLKIEQFRAVPDYECLRYEIYVELRSEFSPEKLLSEIDKNLQKVNIEYKQKRQSSRLTAPRLHLMKRGWAENNLRRHISGGKRDTQYKPQILLAEPLDEDKSFISETFEMETPQVLFAGTYF